MSCSFILLLRFPLSFSNLSFKKWHNSIIEREISMSRKAIKEQGMQTDTVYKMTRGNTDDPSWRLDINRQPKRLARSSWSQRLAR